MLYFLIISKENQSLIIAVYILKNNKNGNFFVSVQFKITKKKKRLSDWISWIGVSFIFFALNIKQVISKVVNIELT